jgi:hypothetical protein
MRVLLLLIALAACGPPANGTLGALCRCDANDAKCDVQVTSCAPGFRCSGADTTPWVGGVCIPVDGGG